MTDIQKERLNCFLIGVFVGTMITMWLTQMVQQ